MEGKKTIKNIAIAFMCLVVVALISFNIYQHQTILSLSQGKSNQSFAINKSTASHPSVDKGNYYSGKEKVTKNSDIDDLKYQLDAAKEELDMLKKRQADEDAKKAEREEMLEELSEMINEDPANKKRLRETIRADIDSSYAILFRELNLSPEDLDKLKDIMVAEEEASSEFTITSVSGNRMSGTFSKKVDYEDEYHKKIEELLGYDNYKLFRTYQENGRQLQAEK